MKLFIKNVLNFHLLLIIIVIPIFILFILFVNNLFCKIPIKSNIETVYIGDSHIENAVNDSLLINSINLASSSESFYFSYFKLKTILNNNSSVKNVYIGFSYHNLSNYYDRFIYGDYSATLTPKYFYILSPQQQLSMLYYNKNNFTYFIKSVIKIGVRKLIDKNYFPFLGGFSNTFDSTNARDTSMKKRIIFQFYNNGIVNNYSELNIEYFQKIITLCKSKGVKLYAINTPIHVYYYRRIPLKFKSKLQSIILDSRINYIDLSNLKLKNEYFIPDGDHLSRLGSQAISVKLSTLPFQHEK